MLLTAYYFMGQDLCTVRRHIRDDLAWMVDAGTDSVAIGIHEFQLDYGHQQQLDILFDEAERVGLAVHAIPSRWAGLVAGWPSAAGRFAATHPDSWMRDADGTPSFRTFCGGALCSIYDPATKAFFLDAIDRMLSAWPVKGLIWDEIKVLHEEDHSKHARETLGEPAKGKVQVQHAVDFFSQASRFARGKRTKLIISCFVYAYLPDDILDACASIDELDYFGIDGRCWPDKDPKTKVLFGNMSRARAACAKHDVGSLALIETQTMKGGEAQRTIAHLPAFLEQPVDHLLYYYHGACREDEDFCMDSMKPLLKKWRERSHPRRTSR